MRILYRDPLTQHLSVTEVACTQYEGDEQLLTFYGEYSICISIEPEEADALTRTLFSSGMLDISSHACEILDFLEDDFEDYTPGFIDI